ncbi:hypothetical protein [uncultured Psychrobacter sp.]|uniref:hypothetical protein n=1 Tax=uncultured Psychrobacter sp. TaxID=259303 RepID=UPI002638ACE1|nr:hypothetical protein [uncultured Psychrobacter sp.]
MSTLIDELEARKNDYVLVADVITLMENATNSTPHEVVKYLDAHNIDEQISIFYMDESYNFEPYNGHLIGLGNDANRTYFHKSDVMAFEPITKHNVFKESLYTNNIVADVYGRTHDVNQYKKNREETYLTLSETIDLINTNINPSNQYGLSVDNTKLRDLARKKNFTPCFYYHGYVGEIDYQGILHTEIIAGYFTYRLLTEEICGFDNYMELPSDGVKIYRIIERKSARFADYDDGLFLFYKNPNGLTNAEADRQTHVEADEIRFVKREVDSYIASLANNSMSRDDTPAQNDSKLLAKLKKLQSENDDLNARLSTARNTYKQHRNEIKALTEKNEKADSEKAELIEQLNSVQAKLADKQTDSAILSNTDIQNIKKAAIKQFNRSLAMALIDLDYQSNLRKGDIVNFIIPYMKELAYVLADEQADKAKVLTVKSKTIYDTHLQGLKFKQGTQTKKERERVNIELLFKKQLPVTE